MPPITTKAKASRTQRRCCKDFLIKASNMDASLKLLKLLDDVFSSGQGKKPRQFLCKRFLHVETAVLGLRRLIFQFQVDQEIHSSLAEFRFRFFQVFVKTLRYGRRVLQSHAAIEFNLCRKLSQTGNEFAFFKAQQAFLRLDLHLEALNIPLVAVE